MHARLTGQIYTFLGLVRTSYEYFALYVANISNFIAYYACEHYFLI